MVDVHSPLVPPLQFVSMVVHVAACILYFISRQGDFDERHTWIGANSEMFLDKSTAERWGQRAWG
jgi:hypothetical protein